MPFFVSNGAQASAFIEKIKEKKLIIEMNNQLFDWENYSHLKYFMATPKQMSVTAIIVRIGNHPFSSGKARKVDFMSWMPCVSGKRRMIACIVPGKTSKGSVAPEKSNIGKYKMQAITLVLLVFLAKPPTIIPILRVDIIVSSQLPIQAIQDPLILTCHMSMETGISVNRETKQYVI